MKTNNNLNNEVNKIRKMMGLNESYDYDLESNYEDRTYIPDDENSEYAFIDDEEYDDDELDLDETNNTTSKESCDTEENLEYGIQGEGEHNTEENLEYGIQGEGDHNTEENLEYGIQGEGDAHDDEVNENKSKKHRLKITAEQFNKIVHSVLKENY